MSHNFKIGDLALVVNVKSFPENLGKVVQIIGLLPEVQEFTGPDGNQYIHRARNGPSCIVSGHDIKGRRTRGRITDGWGVSPACWLMPLQGDQEVSDRMAEVSEPA